MCRIWTIVILSLTFLLRIPASGSERAGLSGASFLKIPIGARMVGLGEAFTAVADDPYALSGNLAGLARNRDLEISFTHVEWLEGVAYEYLAFSKSFFKGFGGLDSTMGLAINYLHAPQFNSFDDWGQTVGSVTFSDIAVTAGYAQNMGFLNAGIALRYINEYTEFGSDGALSFNFGLLYDLKLPGFKIGKEEFIGRELNFGVLLENWSMGSEIGDYGTAILTKLGVAFRPYDNFLSAVEVQIPTDARVRLNVGFEYSLNNILFCRAGYRFFGYEIDSYTMGLGTKFNISGKTVKLDVSFAPQADVGRTLNLSLSMKYPDRISDENRKLANILYYKGIYYYTRGDLDKAIEMWRESLKVNPELEQARVKIQDAEKMKQLQDVEEKVKQKLIDEKRVPQK